MVYLKYYLHQESNIFYRFVYCNNYVKEVDDIYTTNCEIKLNKKGEIKFDENLMENIGKNYNTDNDLKSHIIYKNFESDVIEKNARMLLEIKKSFDLFKL